MKRKSIAFILLALLTFSAYTQESATIAGFARNKNTKEVLPFVTVTINSGENNELVSGTISNENGMFQFPGIAPGDYTVNCSFIGFQTISKAIHVGTLNTNYNLGTIFLCLLRHMVYKS